jgi:hypothetical protein
VALDASTSAARVVVRLAGRPPAALVADWESATIDGAPVPTRLDGLAVARLTRRLPYLWPPGPLALATAAAVMANGLAGGSRVPQLAFVALPGPEGRGGRTLMTPVRLETGRVAEARVATLPPSAQVALDNLLAR